MTSQDQMRFIAELKKVVGARSYDGDFSLQVLLPTKDGRSLRIGLTDIDVGTGDIWFDYYKGLTPWELPENK